MSYGFSPRLPLTYDKTDGPYSLLKTIRDVGQQNLKMIILTNPGERVMDPFFGVGISRFLFNNNTALNSSVIESAILSQVAKYIPYVKITNIEIQDLSDQNQYNFTITYFIESFNTEEILYLNIKQ